MLQNFSAPATFPTASGFSGCAGLLGSTSPTAVAILLGLFRTSVLIVIFFAEKSADPSLVTKIGSSARTRLLPSSLKHILASVPSSERYCWISLTLCAKAAARESSSPITPFMVKESGLFPAISSVAAILPFEPSSFSKSIL